MRSRSTLVTIQKQLPTTNDYEAEPPWEKVATVYADIRPLSGRELLMAQQMQSVLTHRIETEYVQGVTATMRVKAGDRIFSIKSVIDVNGSHRRLELMCTEKE